MLNKQLKYGAVFSYISMLLKIIVSIIYTPIMLRILGQSEYGLYQLVASVIAQLSVLNLGFGSSYIKFYSDKKSMKVNDDLDSLNGMFLVIFIFLAGVVLLSGIYLSSRPRMVFGSELTSVELDIAQTLLVILVFNLSLSFINLLFASYISANENFIFQKLLEITQTLASPFVQLPLLLLGYGSIGLVLGTTLVSIIIYSVNIYYSIYKLNLRFKFNSFDKNVFNDVAKYSSFIFIASIIDQINWSLDIYLVGRFHGTTSTAIYSIAELLDNYFRNFAAAFTSLLTPRVHRLVSDNASNEEFTKLFTQTGRLQFSIMSLIALGVVFFGKAFIYFWAGNGYEQSYYIAITLIIPLMIPIIQNLGIELRRAKGEQKFYTIVAFFTALSNAILTSILLRYFPPISAAISTSFTLLINVAFLNWHYKFKLGIDIKYFWQNILSLCKALIIPIIFGTIINNVVDLNNIITFIISIFIFSLIYIMSFMLFGLNEHERAFFINILKR